jgi:hypothetical protein
MNTQFRSVMFMGELLSRFLVTKEQSKLCVQQQATTASIFKNDDLFLLGNY